MRHHELPVPMIGNDPKPDTNHHQSVKLALDQYQSVVNQPNFYESISVLNNIRFLIIIFLSIQFLVQKHPTPSSSMTQLHALPLLSAPRFQRVRQLHRRFRRGHLLPSRQVHQRQVAQATGPPHRVQRVAAAWGRNAGVVQLEGLQSLGEIHL